MCVLLLTKSGRPLYYVCGWQVSMGNPWGVVSRVYAWGCNTSGQLGRDHADKDYRSVKAAPITSVGYEKGPFSL